MYRLPTIFCLCFLIVFGSHFPAAGQDGDAYEADLARCWSFALNEGAGSALAAEEGRVFIAAGPGRVLALSADGKPLWSADLGGSISSNLLLTSGGVLLVSSPSGQTGSSILRSLSKETGITIWTKKVPGAPVHNLLSVNGTGIIAAGNSLLAFEPLTGAVAWSRDISAIHPAGPVVSNGRLVLGSGERVISVSPENGATESLRNVKRPVAAFAAGPYGELFLGDERGDLQTFAGTAPRPVWRFRMGGSITSVIPVGGRLITASNDNFIYSMDVRKGGVEWKRRFAGRITAVTLISPRHLLVSAAEDTSPLIIDLVTGRSAGRIAFDDGEFMATGPVTADGTVYLVTGTAVYGYRLNGCVPKTDGGPGTPATATKNN